MKNIFALAFATLITSAFSQPKNRPEYFQQEVNFNIRVKLDDVNHTLTGFEEIEYINNSPHQLSFLYFHLWPNAYRNNNTALAKQLLENGETDFYFADPQQEKGFIDSLLFVIDNDTVRWEYDSLHIDICKIYLKKPLSPGDTLHISTPFFVKIPGNYSRLGHVGQSYQITQWFPKPAVYDHNGWNQMPYLTQGEFYSEFGTYDVSITVPENYVVAATGDLYDSPEEEKWLELRAKETQALIREKKFDKRGNIYGPYTNEFPESSPQWKTVRFRQKNVHDFAWFADKRFYVLRGEYDLPKSGRNVTLWSFFTKNNSKFWIKSMEYLRDAVKYYSLWNGEYPYNQVSAVDGTISAGGGMEYPTITVIGDVSSDLLLETVIVHEVGHNWFYGILGSNERLHPWMDEGLNSFNEMRYLQTKYPDLKLMEAIAPGATGISNLFNLDEFSHKTQYELAYLMNARRNLDQPIEEEADKYTSLNYGGIVYSKSAIAFDYLRFYLGEKIFDKCMQTYYERWKFKHPQPQDLQNVFQEISKKNLSWFFEDIIETNDVIDYKLKRKLKTDRTSKITGMMAKFEDKLVIKNKTGTNVPFCVQGIKADTVYSTVWFDGHTGTQVVYFPNGPYDKIMIDGEERIPEINRRNNTIRSKGIFKKLEKPRLQFLSGIENPGRSVLYFSPIAGVNAYDGWMPGLLLHNIAFPQKKLEWIAAPMYGIKSGEITGYGRLDYSINTRHSGFLHSLRPGIGIAHFSISDQLYYSQFTKLTADLFIKLKKTEARSVHNHSVYLRGLYIDESYDVAYVGENISIVPSSYNLIQELNYYYTNTSTLSPWSVNWQLQRADEFMKSSVEIVWKKIYNHKSDFVALRFFAGKFLYNHTNISRYNFRMDGQPGYYDYTYDEVFPARNETSGLWSRQFRQTYGAFKVPTPLGQSNDWLTAVNLKIQPPVPLIRVFADAGISGYPGITPEFLFDAGVYLSLFKGDIEFFFPLVFSKSIKEVHQLDPDYRYSDLIRFSVRFTNINPFNKLKNIPG